MSLKGRDRASHFHKLKMIKGLKVCLALEVILVDSILNENGIGPIQSQEKDCNVWNSWVVIRIKVKWDINESNRAVIWLLLLVMGTTSLRCIHLSERYYFGGSNFSSTSTAMRSLSLYNFLPSAADIDWLTQHLFYILFLLLFSNTKVGKQKYSNSYAARIWPCDMIWSIGYRCTFWGLPYCIKKGETSEKSFCLSHFVLPISSCVELEDTDWHWKQPFFDHEIKNHTLKMAVQETKSGSLMTVLHRCISSDLPPSRFLFFAWEKHTFKWLFSCFPSLATNAFLSDATLLKQMKNFYGKAGNFHL